jgi:hypothetical protein
VILGLTGVPPELRVGGIVRKALIVAALSVALLGAAAGSASAATFSPTTWDFGRHLIGKTSAPKTFTTTVSSGDRCLSPPGPAGVCYPIEQLYGGGFAIGYNTLGFRNDSSLGTCYQVDYLTATNPSCTIVVSLEPDTPGPNNGFVGPNDYDKLGAQITGTGLLPRNSIYCVPVRKGGIYKKNLRRWCDKGKKKKKKKKK